MVPVVFLFAVIVEIIGGIALKTAFVFTAVGFWLLTGAVTITTGMVLIFTGKKAYRMDLKIYAVILLVLGVIYTIFGAFYAVKNLGALSDINMDPAYVSEGMALILNGTALICSPFVLIPAVFGVLLELNYRSSRKPALRIIGLTLLVLAALALIISIALIIIASSGVKSAYGV